ncbi:MAG: hypothetical protein ACLGH0_07855, partial [Thermoanaerobaculia bacterium]
MEERTERKAEPEILDNERAALFRSWLNTPRRRRVELAAYLGDADACLLTGRPKANIESLVSWVDGLAEFGLPVLLYATVVATEGTHFSRSTEPLDKATAALRAWANGGALKLRTSDAERADRPQATIAAIIFSAMRRDKSMAEETRRRVEHVLYEARRYTAIDVLSGSIRHALLTDILRDDSVVPDGLSERARILFAGGIGQISEHEKLVAAVLGRKLAVRGYHLMTAGPSHLTAIASMSFATELEAFGHASEGRLHVGFQWDPVWMHSADAIVLLGVDSAPELLGAAIEAQKPVLPLRSAAGAQLLEYSHARVAHFLADDEDDAELVTDRILAALEVAVGPEAGVAAWRAYSESMAAFIRACDRNTKADAYTLALRQHCVHTPKTRLEEAVRDVPHRAQWLAYDYVNFASSPLVTHARPDAFAILAGLVHQHAQAETSRFLGKRFAEITALPPVRSIQHLLSAVRAISPKRDITEWVHTLTGFSVAECEFRVSIPLEAYWAARRYVAARPIAHESEDADALRRALRGMVKPEPQWLRPYFQSQEAAVRVVGYTFMRLNDCGISGAEWAQQLLTEVRSAVTTSESRPLWQMLLATSGVIERADSSVKRILARALRNVLHVLQPTPTVDHSGECKRRIEELLGDTLANAAQQSEIIRLAA